MAGLNNKSILVTGGTGFIGSHLVERLFELGSNVIVSDICIDPHSFFINKKLHKKVKLEISDVRDRTDMYKLIEDNQPEYIVHLAAQTTVPTAYDNPLETLETNIMGTANILEISRFFPSIKSIIVASSDKAYGKTDKTYTEKFPLKGDHPYDVSKSSADLICQTYYKTYRSPVIVTRFGNVYGEGDLHFDRIIPGICKSIIKKGPLEIRSDGKYVRDYLYVKDVVEGYITLLKLEGKLHGEAFNFSSNDKFSVLELVNKASLILNTSVEYIIKNNAKNEIPYQHLNDAKIRKLGWSNYYNIEKVLPQIIDWYKSIL